ncbi:MAG: hypothetical protein H8E40_07550 [Chloroflexi bacterium]|nr:hypothetical protein [Chloroflexota bacterium]
MNDYTKPFFIGIKRYNRKGEYLRTDYGYLPPLELPREEEKEIVYADMEFTNRQWNVIQQLRGQVAYLQSKYQEQVAERKQSGKLFISKKTSAGY